MTDWITGAAGFVGQHLTRHLGDAGHRLGLIGFDCENDTHAAVNGPLDQAGLDRLVSETGTPERIFHLAGGASVGASIGNPLGDFQATVVTGANLLDWVRNNAPDAAIVMVSSAAVYGDIHPGAITHDAATCPYSPYGVHKLALEQILRGWGDSFGIKSVTARLFSVYGPGLNKQLLWDLCCRIEQGERALTLGGNGTEMRDWTFIGDIVPALDLLAAKASADAPVFNLGSGTGRPVADIAKILTDCWPEDISFGFSGQSRAGDPKSLVAAGEPIDGWQPEFPTSPETGIAAYVDWFQDRPEALR